MTVNVSWQAVAAAAAGLVAVLILTASVARSRGRARERRRAARSHAAPTPPAPGRDPVTRAMSLVGGLVLFVVALVGAVTSFENLRQAAAPYIGEALSITFPLLVDAAILGCTLRYVAGVRRGRFVPAYRVTAHACIAATIILNALASDTPGGVIWHVIAPAMWAVLVELFAREAIGNYKATHGENKRRQPLRLWLATPVLSYRVWLHMARTGAGDHVEARKEVARMDAAHAALRMALPDTLAALRVRWTIGRHMRAGTFPAGRVLVAVGMVDGQPVAVRSPAEVLRSVLTAILGVPEAQHFGRATAQTRRPATRTTTTPPPRVQDAPGSRVDAPWPVPASTATQRVSRDDGYALYAQMAASNKGEPSTDQVKAWLGITDPGNARTARAKWRKRFVDEFGWDPSTVPAAGPRVAVSA